MQTCINRGCDRYIYKCLFMYSTIREADINVSGDDNVSGERSNDETININI